MTYGRTLGKALEKFHIDHGMWPRLAADRGARRETLRLGYPAIRHSKRIAQLTPLGRGACMHTFPESFVEKRHCVAF